MTQKSLLSSLPPIPRLALSSHWFNASPGSWPLLSGFSRWPSRVETLMEWVSIPGNGVWRPYVMALIVSIVFFLLERDGRRDVLS
jgi:hypothetical protein